MNLGYLLSKATRLYKQDLNIRLNEINLTVAQYIILREISAYETKSEPEKHLNPACIAARLNADRPTVTGIVKRLLENGWISRKDHPTDKRSFYLSLTQKAIDIIPKLDELNNKTIHKSVSGLNDEELNGLKKCLNQIIFNLNKGENNE